MLLRIRPAEPTDAAPLAALLNRIIDAGGYTIMPGPVAPEDQRAFIRSFPSNGVFLVAIDTQTGSLVGAQDVMPLSAETPAIRHVGEISTFVELTLRGKGVGRRMCEATFEAARLEGFRKLRATIRADNPGAIAFYQSVGFETIGTAKAHAWVEGRYVDEVIAERSLV